MDPLWNLLLLYSVVIVVWLLTIDLFHIQVYSHINYTYSGVYKMSYVHSSVQAVSTYLKHSLFPMRTHCTRPSLIFYFHSLQSWTVEMSSSFLLKIILYLKRCIKISHLNHTIWLQYGVSLQKIWTWSTHTHISILVWPATSVTSHGLWWLCIAVDSYHNFWCY